MSVGYCLSILGWVIERHLISLKERMINENARTKNTPKGWIYKIKSKIGKEENDKRERYIEKECDVY